MAPAALSADWRRELIVTLAEEDPFCPEPPAEAAEAWTESRIRAFFQAGGADACGAAVPVAVAQVRARHVRHARHCRAHRGFSTRSSGLVPRGGGARLA